MYEKYNKFKEKPYYEKAKLYKQIIKMSPFWFLTLVFPVVRHLNFKKKVVLDIGSGTGFYSEIMKRQHNKVVQVEPFLENLYNEDNVIKQDFLTANIDQTFDYITCIDVLEHINKSEIESFLLKINKLLKPNGRLIVKVPNSSSLAGLESTFGDLTHISHFNLVSLESLMVQNSFQVMERKGIGPNLSGLRFIAMLIAYPLKLLLSAYLYSYGLSGEFHKPGILVVCRRA